MRLRLTTAAVALAAGSSGYLAAALPLAHAQARVEAQIVDFMRFDPVELKVAAGTTVNWTNRDGSNHILQFSDGQKSPRLRHDARYSRSFPGAGVIRYTCAIHGDKMSGTVIVE